MIALSEFTIVKVTEENNKAEFEISPLPTGFGHTLGNSLKRILEVSVPGAAITSVKIDGVQHEYSTLAGVSDDILTVVMGLKNVVFASNTDEPITLEIDVKGKAGEVVEVKASDISKNSDVKVVNEDYVITRLTDAKSRLKAEIVVERGVGYQLPIEEVRQEVGVLPIDAIFSPVKRVSYSVTPTRVGQVTDLDKITLMVETNGALTPSDALSVASTMLQEMGNNFVEQTKDMISGKALLTVPTQQANKASEVAVSSTEKQKLPVADLRLTTRLTNALLRAGFDDLNKLEGFTEEEVANIRGMGEKSLEELMDTLKQYQIALI